MAKKATKKTAVKSAKKKAKKTESAPAVAAPKPPAIGSIGWHDLTVKDAKKVRDFYADVVGWSVSEVEMGGYSDYAMITPGGEAVAGVCHAEGVNEGMPSQWLMYVVVKDIDQAVLNAKRRRGKVIIAPRPLMGGRFAVVADPAGAVCGLYEA